VKTGLEIDHYHCVVGRLAGQYWKVITLTKSGLLAYRAAIRDIESH